jgi:hypothetical protein
LSTFVKLLIIIFVLFLVIISGLGIAKLIKHYSIKRWPTTTNRVYEFRDLNAHDSNLEEGGAEI